MKAHYYAFRYDLLRDPALRAFMQTPAEDTLRVLMAQAAPRIEPLQPTSDILELNEVFPSDDVEFDVRSDSALGTFLGADLSGRGWMCAEIAAEHLHRRRPERAVELTQADIDLLAAMGFLEIHRVLLNGKNTRVAKVGEWVVDKPSDTD